MVSSADLLSLHARAQALIDQSLIDLRAGDLSSPTPCSDWDLRALLAHILGQNRGLAEAARGGGRDLLSWRPRDLGSEPAAAVSGSARDLVLAFAENRLERAVWMPELSPAAAVPGRTALLAHLLDTVVHGWDVASTMGRPYKVEDSLLEEALSIAARVPDGERRRRPDSAFAPSIATSCDDRLSVLLACLGRDPGWVSPTVKV